MRVSRSGYYAWIVRPESNRSLENKSLLTRIRAVVSEQRYVIGARFVCSHLADEGIDVGRARVTRLMKENGLSPRKQKRFKVTTDSNHKLPVASNLLNRQFDVGEPDRYWVSDITYIWTHEGWLYLACILDLYSRKIVGWSMGKRMKTELVLEALKMAYWRRKPKTGLIHHSDRGVQYASDSYQKQLNEYGMICSMSRKGNCWDNAVMESFFKTLKAQCVYQQNYQTRRQAKQSVFEYIEVFYNQKRKHSSIGYLTPKQFEELYYKVA